MGILTWLRSVGAPFLGATSGHRSAAERKLLDEKVRTASAFGHVRFLPYLDNSQHKETPEIRKAYREMLRDASVKAALLDKVLSVAALDTGVNPGDETPRGKEVAEFGEHLLGQMKSGQFGLSGVPGLVESVILPGLIDGFAVAEKVREFEERGPWAGKLLLRYLKSKDVNGVQFQLDEYRNITGLIWPQFNGGQVFHPSNFVLFQHLSLFGNPGGMSDLRSAYRAFWSKDSALVLRMIFLSKFSAGPMLKGTYTDAGLQKTQLEAALQAAAACTWLAIPEGARVDAMDLAMRGTADFEAAIESFNREIFLGVTGAVLQALEGTTTDGRGNSQVHQSTSGVRKWHLKACVESVVNDQVFPDEVELNFANAPCPRLTLGGVDDAELAASLAVDKGLLNDLKLKLSRKDQYKRYGRPMPLDEADTLQPPELPPGGGIPFAEQPKPVPAPAQPPAKEVPVAEPFRETGHASSWGYAFGRED